MPAPARILELTDRFDYNLESYKKGQYNETQVRLEYINPLMEELGWDVTNTQGYSEAYKEVIHEDAVKVGGVTKAPDYCFRIGGTRKFFLEAKKPSVNIKEDTHPSYQLRRYAWSAKLPLSILTDFEEFAVYDCRVKPSKTDKASNARVMYLKFTDYKDKWDEIAEIFSHEAILKGSFDKYVESKRKKKGTAEVDTAFLEEIERWRELLARNIALRNPNLSQREVNFSVQRTIDRIIFLRICEDRGVENYGRLMALQNGERVYKRLFQLFREADARYNSGLFYFRAEKGRPNDIDALTPDLTVDDKVLKDILKNLYYPDSPYEFSVLPSDILGQVYEQFLGKVIRLTPAHRAVIEFKPEVRKAGGVYYTPTYIVDYIVKETVGKLVEGKKPGPRGGVTKLKILDPACGSGSFLLGAYQYLLDWHRDEYVKDDPVKWAKSKNPCLYQKSSDDWRLTTDERKRILLNNIYGVDIDHQAVEVTKLSLLLKVLEGEDEETIQRQLSLFQQRALPDLGNNIKCGNSLIGSDLYNGQLSLFDDEEMYRINAFNWEAEFPEIIKNGGFDAVIGNPPYGFHQIHKNFIKPYFKKKFVSSSGSFEHYFLFYEKSLKLLKRNGLHGFIVPVTWLTIPSAQSLRKYLIENYWIKEIVWLPELVFENAQVNTLVSIVQHPSTNHLHRQVNIKIYDTLGFQSPAKEARGYKQSKFIDLDYYIAIFEKGHENGIIEKISSSPVLLKDLAKPCSGYNPYEVGKGKAPEGGLHTKGTVKTKPYHSEEKNGDDWKPEVIGRNLDRYFLNVTGNRWVKYGPWLAAQRDPGNFKGKRLLVQEITGGKEKRIIGTYYEDELYYSRDVIPIKIVRESPHPFYLLGIINSWLISWYHLRRNPKAQKGLFPKILVSDLKKLPLPGFDFNNSIFRDQHDNLVSLVTRILGLKEKEYNSNLPQEQTILKRQIEATDRQIDKLVYKLYGLTDEEIKIVESEN